jgi:hypothetical protein
MKKLISIFSILSLSLILLFSLCTALIADESETKEKHIDVDYTISCMECHVQETPEITKEWKESEHGAMNYGCYMCHGDGEEEFYAKPGTERCISCHSDQDVDFSKVAVNNCFDCHQGHTLKFHKE